MRKYTVPEPIQGASKREEFQTFSFISSAVVLFLPVRWDINLEDGVEVFLHVVGMVTGGIALNADVLENDLLVDMDAANFKPFRQGVAKAFDRLVSSSDEDVFDNLAKGELNALLRWTKS